VLASSRSHVDQIIGGFDQVEVHRMSGGIVALHMAYKY
jgi:hypothetical protein